MQRFAVAAQTLELDLDLTLAVKGLCAHAEGLGIGGQAEGDFGKAAALHRGLYFFKHLMCHVLLYTS